MNVIFFGAPGTGKSHRIDYGIFKNEEGETAGLKEVLDEYKFRTTFHPDYDYAQFVGAYKPKKEFNKTTNKEEITYSFVPQVFAKAYVKAWVEFLSATDKDVYFVVEEINRGNCAQIFGDIFQLLDRSEGYSEYPIDVDYDFAQYIRKTLSNVKEPDGTITDYWGQYKEQIQEWCSDECNTEGTDENFCKIALPPNLHILATMNTSDQSLFPMDSAFKRRFDWVYVPIKYAKDDECGENWDADKFEIVVGDSKYKWLDFLKSVNADIYDVTQSEDKQMGEFFIKPKDGKNILFKDFLSKVLFYLWDSVYKDETERQTVFHFSYGDGDDKIKSVTFQSLFGKNAEGIVNKIMENLGVEKVTG